VERDLTVQRMRQQTALAVVDRGCAFVAGAFDTQDDVFSLQKMCAGIRICDLILAA